MGGKLRLDDVHHTWMLHALPALQQLHASACHLPRVSVLCFSAGESGGRTEVRWLALLPEPAEAGALGGPAGIASPQFGLLIVAVGGPPDATVNGQGSAGDDAGHTFQFSASMHSMESFEQAAHDHELQQDGRVHVHIDHAHMGVGGDDSWSPSGEITRKNTRSMHLVQFHSAALSPLSLCPPHPPTPTHYTRACAHTYTKK
jgi:hypothetical protein